MLQVGSKAPDFRAVDQNGGSQTLAGLRGRWVVLWWYPKAESGECTLEGIRFEAKRPEFEQANAQLVGISFDGDADNCAFSQAQGFGFPLLSDPDHSIGSDYGVVRPDGDPYADLPLRITFLIDPSGDVARVYEVADVVDHPSQVLADIRSLTSTAA